MSYTIVFPLEREFREPAKPGEVMQVFIEELKLRRITGLYAEAGAVVIRYDLVPAQYFSPMLEHATVKIGARLRMDWVALRNDETQEGYIYTSGQRFRAEEKTFNPF